MTPTPKPAQLDLLVTPVAGAVHPGDKATLYAVVHANNANATNAKLSLSTAPKAATTPSGVQNLGTLTKNSKTVTLTVTVPTTMKPGKLVLTATVSAANALAKTTFVRTITVTAASKATPQPTPKPSLPTTPLAHGGAYPPPSPAGSMQPAGPGVALPQIAAATPSTAPPAGLSGNTTAMRNGSPDPEELTFQRLAGTQAAWLAALLVAFSVLLTQVRIVGARQARPRAKGGHRRTRRGLFEG